MGRFTADVRHVTHHVRCASQVKAGGRCEAMTNYVCSQCLGGLCGRHQDGHRCATDWGME